jgi:hypothetical protein
MRFLNTLEGFFKLTKTNRNKTPNDKVQFKEDISVTLKNESTGRKRRFKA